MATPEELLAQVRITDLRKGGQRTPIKEVKGLVTKVNTSLEERFNKTFLDVMLRMDDLEVIACQPGEVYPFPTADIPFTFNENEDSYWGVFANSLTKQGLKMVAELEGLRVHIKMTGGHMMWDKEKGERTPRECFELIEIIGETAPGGTAKPEAKVAGISGTDQALKLLDGKNIQDWNQIVFQDPAVKSDGDLITSILNNTFIPSMKEKGIVTVDENGVHHVTKGD